jgi:aminomethyltransferase
MTQSISGLHVIETAVFTLSGENTKRWCNGMFSNNFRRMQPMDAHRSAICDDRGRVQGFIDAICIDADTFLCALDGTTLEWFTGRFQMYMMLDDIEMDEGIHTIHHLLSATDLEALNLPVPETGKALLHDGAWIVHRPRLRGHDGFDILRTEESTLDISKIVEQSAAIDGSAWQGLRVDTRTPEFPTDFTDKSFIHDFDLQDSVCNFNKGCYVGQEIINRMDIKELANKKLLRIQCSSGTFTVGASVSVDDKQVGTITAVHPDGQTALAVLKKSAWTAETTVSGDGFTASVLAV